MKGLHNRLYDAASAHLHVCYIMSLCTIIPFGIAVNENISKNISAYIFTVKV